MEFIEVARILDMILNFILFGLQSIESQYWLDRLREMIRVICKGEDVHILRGHVSKDHVHLFLSKPPRISESKLVQRLKGKTSYKLLREFKPLHNQFWGCHLWARGYFVASSGNVTDEVIMEYIKNQESRKRGR